MRYIEILVETPEGFTEHYVAEVKKWKLAELFSIVDEAINKTVEKHFCPVELEYSEVDYRLFCELRANWEEICKEEYDAIIEEEEVEIIE